MADMTGWPTDGADGSVSSEARWRAMARLFAPSGVVVGYLGALAPSLAGGTITIQAGAAWIDGHYAEIAGTSTFTATVTGLVVARFTPADNHFELLYRDGATTPTQGDATWELPIGRVTASVLYDVRRLVPVGGSDTTLLGTATLTAPAAQFDFDAIPQTFTHLRLIAFTHGDAASALTNTWVRFNGDSGANYYTQRVRGKGATPEATFNSAQTGLFYQSPAASSFGSSFANLAMDIPAYRVAAGRQSAVWVTGFNQIAGSGAPVAGDMTVESGFGYRQSTGAITRVTLAPNAGSWVAGSTATLYGLM